ncbi:MAG: cyclic nucleotide-binding domain-containing protein [Lachnospiraceae bacterium]|nr:cyclic nucleotide-binding domain-containing protein [Lachnospiraceae bacterium]MDD3795328.1 cyclic nucleotide-binding domain-containing protein [Lachnospiraceae bacterium]
MEKTENIQQIIDYIKTYDLQQYMNTNLAEIAELISFERNDYLVEAGIPSIYLYFLVRGKIICSSFTTNDKSECIAYHQAVTIVGEAASFWNMPPAANVKALSRCTCIAINLNRYRHVLLSDLRFLQNICKTMACRINHDGQTCTTLIEPLDMRLAKFMLAYSNDSIFTFQLTDCADILNTSYRHLLRMLKKFTMEKLVLKNRHGYLISDSIRMQQIADGESTLSSGGSSYLP